MPENAPDRTSGTTYVVTEDCDDPRYSKVRVVCDVKHVALHVRDFLSREENLGTIYGDFLVYEHFQDLELIESED